MTEILHRHVNKSCEDRQEKEQRGPQLRKMACIHSLLPAGGDLFQGENEPGRGERKMKGRRDGGELREVGRGVCVGAGRSERRMR